MKKALILIGWFQKTDGNWYPWLKKELEKKSYQVFVPDLPTIRDDIMDMNQMLKYLEKLKLPDKDTIVIGHSIGAVLAMRLAEKYPYKKMISVAGWDFNELTEGHKFFWKTTINHTKIKKNVKEVYVISSDNDPYTTAFISEEMSKRLGGKFILVKGAVHFCAEQGVTEVPEILKLV